MIARIHTDSGITIMKRPGPSLVSGRLLPRELRCIGLRTGAATWSRNGLGSPDRHVAACVFLIMGFYIH